MVDDPQSANAESSREEPSPDPSESPPPHDAPGPTPRGGSSTGEPGTASRPLGDDPFSGPKGPPDPSPSGSGAGFASSGEVAFALDVAKMWLRDYQKEAMVGAFATGVFLGSLLRD